MSKENLHFDYQSVEVVSLYSSQCFLKEIGKMLSMFLLNTQESLGNLKKALEVSTAFLVLPKFHLCLNSNTVHVFYFLNESYMLLNELWEYRQN